MRRRLCRTRSRSAERFRPSSQSMTSRRSARSSPPAFAPIPVFAGLTGLRCSEWLALERGDVDRRSGVVHVRREVADGKLKLYGKQSGSLKTVPLTLRAAESLGNLPPRLDTSLLFPGARGGFPEPERVATG